MSRASCGRWWPILAALLVCLASTALGQAPTLTFTPAVTHTPTLTPTPASTPTLTFTNTPPVTHTPTATPSITLTPTPTPTAANTATPTAVLSPPILPQHPAIPLLVGATTTGRSLPIDVSNAKAVSVHVCVAAGTCIDVSLFINGKVDERLGWAATPLVSASQLDVREGDVPVGTCRIWPVTTALHWLEAQVAVIDTCNVSVSAEVR